MRGDPLNELKTRNPLWVFGIFSLGIILPGGFLSYLGLRSFQYEGLLMRKQAEERHAAVADLMEKKADERLANWVAAVRGLAGPDTTARVSFSGALAAVLAAHRLDSLTVENLFAFDDQERMVAPWADEPAPVAAPHELDWGPLRDEVARLERSEFIDKDLAGALKGYAALKARALTPDQQAALLKNIAAIARKLRDYAQAEEAYGTLLHRYDQVPDVSGLPTGLLAHELLIKLWEDERRPDRALDMRLDLLDGLLLRRWALGDATRERFIAEQKAAIGSTLRAGAGAEGERRNRWYRWQTLENRLKEAQAPAQAFAKTPWPDLVRRLRRRGWMDQGGVLQPLSPGWTGSMAIVAPLLGADQRRRGMLVALVPAGAAQAAIERDLVELATPVNLRVLWRARSALGLAMERQIRSLDPPLAFQLEELGATENDRLSRRRLWIYGGMVGLSLLVIVVGLWMMRRAVKREIEVANLKADFVANVSHELRTPLAAIAYIGERLSLGRYQSEGERQEFYGMLGEETQRLRELIEDILDFSKMLAGKKVYKRNPLNLAQIAQEAHDRFDGKARAQGFEVQLSLPREEVPILGDRRALIQSVLNLLDNALKYSGSSRRIAIHVARTGGRARIAVEDFGIGIADADQAKVFEKFYRVEPALSRDSAGGVGLGLAMVKHVVEGHQGMIHLRSHVGKGSTFTIELPLDGGRSNVARLSH